MKKKIITLLTIIFIVCCICNITYAAETNVTLEKNKNKYTGGEIVEISVKINNITLEKGIETIIAKIGYNKELYESCTIEEKNGWEADFNEQNGKIILQRDDAIKENHLAFVIKLKIKDSTVGNDEISLTQINIADENTDLFPESVKTSITIENSITDEEKEDDKEDKDEETQPEIPQEKQLIGIEISNIPTKTTYITGEKFDKTGMKVVAKYSDGSSKEITDYTIPNGDKLTKGQTSVTVSYTESNITKTTTQKISVIDKSNNNTEDKKGDNKVIDNTLSKDKIPHTGFYNIFGIIVFTVVVAVICFARYNQYKKI